MVPAEGDFDGVGRTYEYVPVAVRNFASTLTRVVPFTWLKSPLFGEQGSGGGTTPVSCSELIACVPSALLASADGGQIFCILSCDIDATAGFTWIFYFRDLCFFTPN